MEWKNILQIILGKFYIGQIRKGLAEEKQSRSQI